MYDHLNKTKIFAPMIAIAIIFSFLGFNNVSAIEDYVYTWDWDTHPSYYLCGSNSGRDCSDYSYVIFEPTGSCSDSGASMYVSGVGGSGVNSLISVCSKIIAPVGSINLYITGGQNLPQRYTGDDITITLTESLPGSTPPIGSLNITENGTFDVSEVATAVVNVPQDVTEIIEDPVSNDFHKIFMVVVAGVIPAFAVFVIVWFAIDLMSSLFFGRGK